LTVKQLLPAPGICRLVLAFALSATLIAEAGDAIEGEYEGDGYAAQVIALPNGKFHIVGWRRGLPGVSANAERIADADGIKSGGAIHFKGNIWTAAIDSGGELTAADDQSHGWTLHRITRESPTLGARPSPGATVLFDGSDASAWAGGRMDDHHLLLGGAESKQRFESYILHLEFLVPSRSSTGSLGIGGYYEIPIRDSFGQEPDEQSCGAIRHLTAPSVNASLPPGQWQTLDLDFTCAGFDTQDRKTKNAVVTMKQNGIPVHQEQEITGPTDPAIPETPGPGPLLLRDPSGEIRFRNIWVVEKQ
jgi:hypothetical protein